MNVDTRTGELMDDAIVGTLKELRQGGAVVELSEALADLVTAVRATGSKGSMVITLTVAPAAKGEVNALLIEDSVKLKLPRSSRGATILFANNDGVLSRKDPRQPELVGLVQVTQFPMPSRGEGTGTHDE
jgi:hypothetical protein